MVGGENDVPHSQYAATEPVVQQLANLVAQNTQPLSHETKALRQQWRHLAASISTKHTAAAGSYRPNCGAV